jgi:hypothetical protein
MVQHIVHPLHGLAHGGQVAQVALDEIDAFQERAQVVPPAGAEVVQHAHSLTVSRQFCHDTGANEASSAGDQI